MERRTVENIILMINILQSRDCVSGKELAERLNVSKRTIQKYKIDLEKMNIVVKSNKGKYGGYYIDRSILDFNIPLNQEEYRALEIAGDVLENDNRYHFNEELSHAIEKIGIGLQQNTSAQISRDNLLFDSKPNIYTDLERYKFTKIQSAIQLTHKLDVEYQSLQSGKTERIIHPYTIFACNGFPYVIAYCELRKEVRSFRISRISNIKKQTDNYSVPEDMNLSLEIRKDEPRDLSNKVLVKLLVKQPMAHIIMERIWSDDQKISKCDSGDYVEFQASLPNTQETVCWILSMGQYVEIMEPESLKEKVIDEIRNMTDNYR